MNILKILAENEEIFFPWSDEDNPPLDAKKNFIKEEREREEDLEGWVSL